MDYYTTPLADLDNNGIPDVREYLAGLTPNYIGLQYNTDLNYALNELKTFTQVLSAESTPNIIFLSDGYDKGFDPVQAAADAQELRDLGANLTAFGIGPYSTLETLSAIDPDVRQLLDVRELTDILGGWDSRYAIEPLVEGATVYLDTNNNGQLDEGEPWQVTRENRSDSLASVAPFHYHFENLVPDPNTDYTLRFILPDGYTSTAPSSGSHTVQVTDGETVPRLFGWHDGSGETQNGNPTFLTEAPTASLNAGERFTYNALATDPDADLVSYELALAPAGMSVDPETGMVVWTPTAAQVEAEYARLQETRDRLEAAGRGDFAPETVTFNVFLVARDSQGGQALQTFTVELLEPNRIPSFTSTLPNGVNPQLGKAFAYQATALDADGDTLTYELVDAPTGATIDPNTGLLTWTPQSLGETTLTLKVSDGNGGEALQTLDLEVLEPQANRPPTIASTPRTRSQVGTTYAYRLDAVDPDGELLTYTLLDAPAGATLDGEGRLFWNPDAAQMGDHPITVEVRDPSGATATQTWTLTISDRDINSAPEIVSTPTPNTHLDRLYRYDLEGIDPDGDPILWALLDGPEGAVIDPETGRLSWQPTPEQLGEQTFLVRAMDARGAYTVQEFTLEVSGANIPPLIASVPPTEAGIDGAYRYNVVATDSEQEALTYRLNRRPEGMTINAQTGEIQWTPEATGRYEVEVEVQDASGGTATQTWTIEVGTTAPNLPPTITSTPVYVARTAQPYSYQVIATDPEGTTPSYELLNATDLPAGIAIDSSGQLTWDNPQTGTYTVVVGANDGNSGAAQAFTLTVRENAAPSITSTPPNTAAPGRTYRYDVQAADPNGDDLSYRIENAPDGMEIDEFGRISWNVPQDATGNYTAEVIVTDTFGAETTQLLDITAFADTEAPALLLQPVGNVFVVDGGGYQVDISTQSTVSIRAVATDNIAVDSVQFLIDGTAVATDANGVATVPVGAVGTTLSAIAIATDTAGNTTQETLNLDFIDLSVTTDLVVNLDLSGLNGEVTEPVEIRGTVADNNGNPVSYKLEAQPVGGGEWVTVFEGTEPVTDGVLGTFDPTLLPNDTYTLRLTATDSTGASSFVEEQVDVTGELKLGNFQLSFTDLEVPVSGIPITVTRTYDSLYANQEDNFGYGWRLEFRDTNLKTSLPPQTPEEKILGEYPAFKDGSKVYITLPGGKRTSFTFQAKLHPEVEEVLNMGAPWPESAWFYQPQFVADDGSGMTLSVEIDSLLRDQTTGEYRSPNGLPYNPQHPFFGGAYTLTTKEGIEYEIDATSGDLNTITDLNGNTLTYSEGGIVSSAGKEVKFERDAQGRISAVIDPAGERIEYEYDANGDLIAVIDREENRTEYFYEESTRPHYLTRIEDPLGRNGIRTEYDETTGRLARLLDVNGEAVELTYDLDNSVQTVRDVYGNPTTYVYDSRGNVLTEVGPEGWRIDRTYDDNNNLLTETDADGVTTQYTYDERQNLLTIQDESGSITRMTYNGRNQVTSIVSPTGLKTTAKYDSRGNLVESIDTNGLRTTYTYNPQGQLLTQTAPDGQVTTYDYDTQGNIKRTIDSRGNEVGFDYNPNGNIEVATTTFNLNGQTHTLAMEYDYDKEGRIIASRTSQGNSQSTIYDALGRVKSMTDVFGNVTSYNYDLQQTAGQNNDTTVTRIDEITLPDNTPNISSDNPKVIQKYDAANNLIAEISPTGLETRYVYDDLNRLTEVVLPDLTPNDWADNPRNKTEYSDGGRIKSQTDILGNKTQYLYNDIGQITQVINAFNQPTTYTYTKGGQIETVTDHRNRKTRYIYDNNARVQEIIFFDDSRFKLTYDELGRLKTETNELNQTTTYEYDAYGQVKAVINALNERTEFEYNQRHNLIRVTDALGQSTHFKYDEYGQKVETTFHNGDTVSMAYDQFSRLTSTTDENLNPTKYTYDNLSQLVQIEQVKQLAANGQLEETLTQYTYDNLFRLKQIEDANQNVTSFEYDAFNRPTETVLPLGQRNRTDYNSFGQVTAATDFNGDTINYTYDSYGRLENKTFTDPRISPVSYTYDPVTLGLSTVTDSRGVMQYTYDNYDRLETITTPDQKTVGYGYDLLNNLTSLTTPANAITYGYDPLNRLDTVKEGNRILADYDYNAVGNLSQTQLANGSVESRLYDTRNRLTQLTTRNVTGTIFNDFKYTLDGVGNRTKVEEYGGRTVDYTYDALNRLTQENMVGGATGNRTIDYTYDLVGNRLTRNDSASGLATYTYDDNNRLQQLTQGSQTTAFGYDDNGSITQRSDGSQTITYDWINDGENRLVGVTNSTAAGTSQTQFVYDALGNRVATVADGVQTNYLTTSVGSLPEVLMEYDANDQITANYTHGLGLVSATRNGREGFYHTDGLGSTRAITDNVGLVTDRYTYDAFGVLLDQTGTFGNSFQFAGEQRDSSTGLDYLRARYYDPTLGRFISKDPFSGFLSDPMSQHDYQYAHANPVRFTDPTGYSSTIGDVMATLNVIASLSTIGSVGVGAGYITGGVLSGASSDEILQMFGDWGAGFANGVSGGYLTDVYESYSGNKVEPTHGALWGAGTVTGIGVSFLLGMKLPSVAATAVGPLKWVATAGVGADLGFDIYGALKATKNLYESYQDNGRFEIRDSWNLLSYVPLAGMIGGIKRGIGAARKVKGSTPGPDDVLATQSTRTVAAGGGPKCFVAGTKVLTTEGMKNIEDIRVGDWVIADDPTTPGGIEKRQVLDTFVREATELYDLYVDGEVISTTGEHPFWTPDKGWVEAKDLVVGDLLQTDEETFVDVDRIEKREGKFEVYNFKVEGFPTYFVSELGILVHNADYFAERALLGSRKHGLNWTEGPARAKKEGIPQGQFRSKEDIDFAVDKARGLGKGNQDIFDLPANNSSIVHMPDGTTVPATKVFVKVYPSGKVHAYPLN
ncbi:putative Ig domain-containing protein [Lusitaniella coriacea]|uniref:putative Ig domain-containing protein n=1 Tax=Lusitaniella coriacea TaxID=1983105 RepID=UPI001D15A25A|nr:putative Ig domain-containing protein [Lusitaniella coriacea]